MNTDNIVVWTGIQCRRAIVHATIDETSCPLMTNYVVESSVPSCKVSTMPNYVYAQFYSVVTRKVLQSMCLLCVHVHEENYLVWEG